MRAARRRWAGVALVGACALWPAEAGLQEATPSCDTELAVARAYLAVLQQTRVQLEDTVLRARHELDVVKKRLADATTQPAPPAAGPAAEPPK